MTMHRQSPSTVALCTLALAATLVVAGCGKKAGGVAGPGSGTGTLNGLVTIAGTGGTPVAGATVKSTNGDSTLTSAGGQFTLNLASGQDLRVDVSKDNYTLNQLQVRMSAGESRSVSVGLLAAGNTAAMAVGSGGGLTDPSSNARIVMPPNFVVASGPVSVTITGLDPTTDQITALPGGLEAVDGTGATKFLKPVSFAEYTVRDASGRVLPFNPSAGAGANIELPIPASLRGQPGYANGDPIECYVYDPADGKWKTPVPGTIGPSSVDGQPAIKATIFHLSWYGGAPASSDVACIQGTVRDSLSNPLAGVSVEAFPGSRGTTDGSGHYQLEAAANSSVRVVSSRLLGGVFQAASDTVQTGGPGAPCIVSNSVLQTRRPSFSIDAQIGINDDGGEAVPSAMVNLLLGDEVTGVPVSGATVQIGTGGAFTTLPDIAPGSGMYFLLGGTLGDENFTLVGGAVYTIRLDFDHNGSFDATGQVQMAGLPIATNPTTGSVQPRTFSATWSDAGAGAPGYDPRYIGFNSRLTVSGAELHTAFIKTTTSHVLGSGTADPLLGLPNPPLTAGAYDLALSNAVGPYAMTAGTPGVPSGPNISGNGASGYFYSFSSGALVEYSSTGNAMRPASGAVATGRAVRPRTARERAALLDRQLKLRISQVRILEAQEEARRNRRATNRATR